MDKGRLNIVKVDNVKQSEQSKPTYPGGKARRLETQAYFDRLWLHDPSQFDPSRNCMESERINRTQKLIEDTLELKEKNVLDLGCGYGELSRRMRDLGGTVTAVDISDNCLKIVRDKGAEKITLKQDYAPLTSLEDNSFDLVICTELIAYLQPDEYRLLFSELARLVKRDGFIVCSTPIDIYSEDALQKFNELAETEIQIHHWILSWHLCYIKLKNILGAPAGFIRASRDQDFRNQQLKNRYGFNLRWFKFNSAKPMALFWLPFYYLFYPLVNFLKKSRTLLLFLEKFCRFIWSDAGISHAIFIGERRKFTEKLPENEIPVERKHKREVWE